MLNLVVSLVFDALADLRGFTGEVTQVEELGAAHNTVANELNATDARAVVRESSFHADAVRDTTDGESFAGTAATATNNQTFKSLQTLAGSFNNLSQTVSTTITVTP